MREEIRSGRTTRERKLAVCSGSVSLAAEERAELLTILAGDSDAMVAERAGGALLSQPKESFIAAVAREDAAPQLLLYCSKNLLDKPGIADALAKNRNCPAEFLIPAAQRLSTSTVQALMEDLDRLSSAPALAAALAASPSLTAEQRLELQELQEGAGGATALEEAAAAAEPDPQKRTTLIQRLMRMNVVERVQLALKGNGAERLALIRDPCKIVQRAVLQSAQLTDKEVEAFSAMANLSDEVLRQIGLRKMFLRNYIIVRNLVNNPKTPMDISLRLLQSLHTPDLKMLTTNKNVADTVRSTALKLYRQRTTMRERS